MIDFESDSEYMSLFPPAREGRSSIEAMHDLARDNLQSFIRKNTTRLDGSFEIDASGLTRAEALDRWAELALVTEIGMTDIVGDLGVSIDELDVVRSAIVARSEQE